MFGGTQGSTAAVWGRGSRCSDPRLGGVGSDLRQAVACTIAGSGSVDGAAWSPGSRRGSPRVAAVDERYDDRPPTVRGSCRGWRAPTAAELDALCSASADPRNGFETARARTIFRRLIHASADIQITPAEIIVKLGRRANNPQLIAAGYADYAEPIAWLGNRTLVIQFV